MCLLYLQRISFLQVSRNLVSAIHRFLEIDTPHTVILHPHGVNTRLQHRHILAVRLIAHDTSIYHIKIGIELNNSMLLPKCFPAIRHILLIHILRFQIFKLLTTIKMQIQMLFISRHFQSSRIRLDNLRILKPLFEVINQHVVKHTRFTILMLYIKVIAINLVIENTFRYIQFRRFLLHGNQQCPQLSLRLRSYYILEIKRNATDKNDKHNQRAHNLK